MSRAVQEVVKSIFQAENLPKEYLIEWKLPFAVTTPVFHAQPMPWGRCLCGFNWFQWRVKSLMKSKPGGWLLEGLYQLAC